MKNLFKTICATLLICKLGIAQTHPVLTLGVNSCNLRSNIMEPSSMKGINGGFAFYAILGEKFSLLSDFYYEKGGANTKVRVYEPTDETFKTDETYKLTIKSYSWALLGQYFVYDEKIMLQGGLHLGMINRIKYDMEGGNHYYGTGDDVTKLVSKSLVEQSLTRFNYGATFGIAGKKEDFILSLRYNLGLKNFGNEGDGFTPGYSIFRNSMELRLMYVFSNVVVIPSSGF